MNNLFLSPLHCVKDGFLTYNEVQELQRISNKYRTVFYVIGSRANGSGRNIDKQNLKVGKGIGTRSDIDIRIDGQMDINTGGRLSHEISNVSNGSGNPRPLIGNEPSYPAIIFKPE